MIKIAIGGYTRISKASARKLFESGEAVLFCPSKMRPDNIWCSAIPYSSKDNVSFDVACNVFSYYNCDSERGKTIYYYTREAAIE